MADGSIKQAVGEKNLKASVVILTWNSMGELGACLSSLPQGLTAYPYEVIVVDNGSRDLTPAIWRDKFPPMRLLTNRRNRGVAPARNQGIRVTQGEYVILLDDDAVVQPGAFDCLIAYLDEHPEVALCGPKLVDPRGQLQLSCRLFPTLGYKLARRFFPAFARRVSREVEMADWDHSSVREVDYVIGACQVIRWAALAEIGLLDEWIFYGPEDIDLCLRMHKAGWRVTYNPEAVVIHHERRGARSLFSLLGWRHLWGILYYFYKHGYLFSRRRIYAYLPNKIESFYD
jgi:N-acetylglucosaminyl-diphospho-decaprenol L-rhamnosyltransferase